MTMPPATRFYVPLTAEQNRIVTRAVSTRITEHWKAASEDFLDNPLFLNEPSGRERLAFYRSTTYEWWAQLAAIRPDRARFRFHDWRALRRKYPQG